VVNTTFSTLGQHDVTTFTPLVILIAMLLLWLIFRRLSGVFLTITVVIFTFTIVLALQTIFGYKLNNFTANMPVFIIAIGIADAMHLFWVYLLGRKRGLSNYAAIYNTLEKNMLPIFLTSLTTAIGFASLGVSNIIPVKTLGLATANAAILAFVLTVLFVPAALAILNIKVKVTEKKDDEKELSNFSHRYARFIIHTLVKKEVEKHVSVTGRSLTVIICMAKQATQIVVNVIERRRPCRTFIVCVVSMYLMT